MPETRYKSPILWIGGKFGLAKRIVPLFPEHLVYCEVFGGAAHILFNKERSQLEILNDLNGELVNFWRVYAKNPQYFEDKLRYILYSRQIFNELKATNPNTLSEEDRAWRFLYLNRCSFSGIMDKDAGCPRFATSKCSGHSNNQSLFGIADTIRKSHERFQKVIVENLDWKKCIELYDKPHTFFYLDPPYEGHETAYGKGLFQKESYKELAEFLTSLSGKFLLSINESQFMRDTFSKFNIVDIDVLYTVKYDPRHKGDRDQRKQVKELIITNYPVENA